ncbi:hypothetical protein [Streptomyces zaomyceticus]|uniref:hypothetical protein n=1 Tax=Streptomyces zaomyceticus TaxID=68286 RepID=UPI0036832739
MTIRKNLPTAVTAMTHTPDKPVVLFSDEGSAVLTPRLGPGCRQPRPLDILVFQAPPALPDTEDSVDSC